MNYIKKLLVFVTRYFTSWALTCGIAWVLFKIFHATFDIRFVSGVWLILALFDKFVQLGQEPLEVREHEQL